MKDTANIEAIYPLTFMQQGLLLHHLSEEQDQGFLNTQCTLKGHFNLDIFKESCRIITKRHEVIRSTVHWRDLEKQVRVVHKNKDIAISYLDWKNLSKEEQKENWNKLKASYTESRATLESGALLKIDIVRLEDHHHKLLWPMHHLLLDGWSGSILLKDIVNVYNNLYHNEAPQLETIPNYRSYLNWVKSLPEEEAKTFWSTYLNGFKDAKLFGDITSKASIHDNLNLYKISTLVIPKEETDNLKTYCKTNKITINTFIQSVWSLVISRYFNTNDVVHGVTVSGRAVDFPNIDAIAGMFMNLQPVRGEIDEQQDFSVWFQKMQKLHFEARNYEHLSLDTLYTYCNWSENTTLFDSLVVFENYPIVSSEENILKVSDVKSGLTSTYPITLAIMPGDEIKFVLSCNSTYIADSASLWIIEVLKKIINLIVEEKATNYKTLKLNIGTFQKHSIYKNEEREAINLLVHQAPKNKTELALLQIWERALGIDNISTDSNFLKLGGKSLMAVKMVSSINKKLQTKLPVTKLLEYPTITQLSDYILSDSKPEPLKHIVPIRSKGDKNSLFCIHAGGGHVMFYGHLKDYLKEGRPIYALQPSGLNEGESVHKDVETMSKDYLKAIQTIQPKGPYNILVHCFSTTVGNEMSILLDNAGEEANIIVIDTMASSWGGVGDATLNSRIDFFFKRLLSSPIKTTQTFFRERYHIIEPWLIKLFGTLDEKRLKKVKTNLIKMSVTYKFKPHNGKISLILTDRGDKRFEDYIIDSWKKLAKGGVKVFYSKGKHITLFEKPDVAYISEQIDLTMKD